MYLIKECICTGMIVSSTHFLFKKKRVKITFQFTDLNINDAIHISITSENNLLIYINDSLLQAYFLSRTPRQLKWKRKTKKHPKPDCFNKGKLTIVITSGNGPWENHYLNSPSHFNLPPFHPSIRPPLPPPYSSL